MNGLDYAVIGILLLSMLLGFWRGLISEVLSLVGWPIAIVFSKLTGDSFAPMLPIEQEEVRIATAYALVFVATLIVFGVIARLITRMLKAIGSDWADRAMGGLFGILRGALVVLVLVWLAGLTHLPDQAFWRSSVTGRTLEEIAMMTKSWLPDNIGKRIHYRIHG